jgi:phosphate regulon transcriptional regulator PhoB
VGAHGTILVVEDEPDTRELLRFHLEHDGYGVAEASTGEAAWAAILAAPPRLVLLDLMLPGTGGLELCRQIRTQDATRALPVVILTGRNAELDRVLGLEMGADDYITKPFSPRELLARIRAVLRRAHPDDPERAHHVFRAGRLAVDFDTREVRLDGRTIHLSLREFELLRFFVQHPHRVYGRDQLLELVWGRDVHVHRRTVDAHIRRLRRRVERLENAPELILTVRGVGYKFNPEALSAGRAH